MPLWEQAVALLAAFLLSLPIAINRERYSRVMGLRTYPLVSLGACAYIVIGIQFVGMDNPDALARILQGLMGGIGFVGGGAILKSDDRVRGTASAACIWILGAVGAACALHQWVIAAALCLAALFVLNVFYAAKKQIDGKNLHDSDDD